MMYECVLRVDSKKLRICSVTSPCHKGIIKTVTPLPKNEKNKTENPSLRYWAIELTSMPGETNKKKKRNLFFVLHIIRAG